MAANTYTKITSSIVSTGLNISIASIPQTYKDLAIHISGRTDFNGSLGNLAMWFNNDGSSIYSVTNVFGSGTGVGSNRVSSTFPAGVGNINSAATTGGVFTSAFIYIPNYTSTTTFKSAIVETVTESNSGTAYSSMHSLVYRSTNAIDNVAFNGNQVTLGFISPTSLSVYGIKNS